MAVPREDLPNFEYFLDPIANGCVVPVLAKCPCCEKDREFMYCGPIYCKDNILHVCPWCIHSGEATRKWDASFNDAHSIPKNVPKHIIETVCNRTPGFEGWQTNHWLFSETDAMMFVGEIDGVTLLAEADDLKIAACRRALDEWHLSEEFDFAEITRGGQPAVYLFRDRQSGEYSAYADMT
jgi:uncharacterized protein CbrC (UPF0167 family)